MNKLGIWGIVIVAIFILVASQSQEADATHNANLFVSAENAQFDNFFAGPMVIEVKIVDPDLNDLDDAQGEPDVKVNGNKLRMAQATDGNWYAYIADRSQALLADSLSGSVGFGLDFGKFCDRTTVITGVTFSQTVGIAVAQTATGGVDGTGFGTPDPLAACTAFGGALENHVVRENKALNSGAPLIGQIGLSELAWPVIQLYNFNPTGNVIIQYNKAGGIQSTTLTFDTVDQFAGLELNKPVYLNNEGVLVTITDLQLNIDPTSKDSWTWGTATSTFYRLFDENGQGEA